MWSDGRENSQFRSFSRRAAVLAAGQSLLFGVLASRIYYLQVLESEQYKVRADRNRISLRLLPPRRGRVLDRSGVPLAANRQNFQVVLIPERAEDLPATLDALSYLIPISSTRYSAIIREATTRRGFVPIVVADNLSWDAFARVNVNSPDLRGIQPMAGETRDYPHGSLLAHVLGYVGVPSGDDIRRGANTDPLLKLPGFKVGKSGVEQIHDRTLRGKAGTRRVEVNAYDRVIRELDRNESESGGDVVLTIDVELQKVATAALTGHTGAVVCMDAQRGDILAMASTPGFDPNAFNIGLSDRQWRELVDNPKKPLINKAVTGLYPAGSTIKPIVGLAALKAGIGAAEEFYCPGYMQLGNQRFHCWRRGGHGHMNLRDGIKHSCDVYFYEAAKRIGIDAIAQMASRFGLGQTPGLGFPSEKAGVFPTPDWKHERIGKPWVGGETLIAAIGQGYVQTTPLQLAVMTARLANGGKAVLPRLYNPAQEPTEIESLQIPKAHLNLVLDGMSAVVNERRGTAYELREDSADRKFAGKTGTAQVRRISRRERLQGGVRKNEDLPWEQRDHALFVGFAPVDTPRYAVSVIVEHGGSGSKVAGPIARDVLVAASGLTAR